MVRGRHCCICMPLFFSVVCLSDLVSLILWLKVHTGISAMCLFVTLQPKLFNLISHPLFYLSVVSSFCFFFFLQLFFSPSRHQQGGIHPRFKLEVGRRLAVAAYNLLFGGQAAHTGPTISGCTASGTTITVQFNSTLLNGDSVLVQPFDTNVSNWSMKDSNSMAVCIGDPSQILDCLNDTTLWVPASLTAGSSGNAVVATAVTDDDHVDGGTGTSMHRARVGSNGTVLAIKYGWPVGARGTDSCCPTVDVGAGHMPCVPGSCPLITKASSLPANPFLAFIVDNKCQCMAPQVCSE
eukprot:m.132517 g.132517  ORF g.132517 m.132517 type:complete len:295 (+) comp11335_c0_seq3:1-885(+)